MHGVGVHCLHKVLVDRCAISTCGHQTHAARDEKARSIGKVRRTRLLSRFVTRDAGQCRCCRTQDDSDDPRRPIARRDEEQFRSRMRDYQTPSRMELLLSPSIRVPCRPRPTPFHRVKFPSPIVAATAAPGHDVASASGTLGPGFEYVPLWKVGMLGGAMLPLLDARGEAGGGGFGGSVAGVPHFDSVLG